MTERRIGFLASWVVAASCVVVAAFALMVSTPSTQQAQAQVKDPAVAFMERVAKDLIAASRAGSTIAFSEAFNKYSHVPAIGLYALGPYKPQLQPSDRSNYYRGMIRFVSRYAARESQKYPPSHAEFPSPGRRTPQGVIVDSRVVLKDGSTYDVQWLLQPRGNSFRIRDAKVTILVAEYWLSPFLKVLFETYIAENGGTVRALVTALNQ